MGSGGSGELIWLCKICHEQREIWKKSGAWFFKVRTQTFNVIETCLGAIQIIRGTQGGRGQQSVTLTYFVFDSSRLY